MATTAPDRILTLDVIRGVAVMGIFSVNVVAFAMIEAAYFYPPAFGFHSVWDKLVWLGNFIFIDGKMRSLFSMLFGASALLVIERAERSGRSPAVVHYGRMLSLLVFGLIHFYLLWWGDILALYALVGMVAYAFRKLETDKLLAIALIGFAISFAASLDRAIGVEHAIEVHSQGAASSEEMRQADTVYRHFHPSAAEIREDAEVHRSFRAYLAQSMGTQLWRPWTEFRSLLAETLALMLLGMAGLRSGFLTGEWSDDSYGRVAQVTLSIGIGASAIMAAVVWLEGFRLPFGANAMLTYSAPLRPVMAIGFAALIIRLSRRVGPVTQRIAAAGRCAFTNYLGTSIIAGLVFNGWGLGLYGKVSRAEAWLLVPIVWALMLLWSKPWLERFNYGPFEWAWRSLSRGKLQPMRKRAPAAAIAAA
jgi:uncharacterized protein